MLWGGEIQAIQELRPDDLSEIYRVDGKLSDACIEGGGCRVYGLGLNTRGGW